MQQPHANAATPIYLKYGDHTEGALEAWSDMPTLSSSQRTAFAGLIETIRTANTNLRIAAASTDEADRTHQKARARFIVSDCLLDLRVMNTSDALLNGPAMRSRQSPVYQEVFQGQPASDLTSIRRYDQPEAVQQLLARFQAVEDFEGKATAAANLEDALKRSLNARDGLDQAELAANKAGDVELTARLTMRSALEQVYGQLRSLFAGQRDFVEAFFYRPEKGASDTTVTTTGTTGG